MHYHKACEHFSPLKCPLCEGPLDIRSDKATLFYYERTLYCEKCDADVIVRQAKHQDGHVNAPVRLERA